MNSVRVLTISEANVTAAIDTYLQSMRLIDQNEKVTGFTVSEEYRATQEFNPTFIYSVAVTKEVSN